MDNAAYRSLNRSGAEGRSWSSGWAVGGWFIPLAALVIPRLVLSEIERISHPDNGPAPIGAGWRRTRQHAVPKPHANASTKAQELYPGATPPKAMPAMRATVSGMTGRW